MENFMQNLSLGLSTTLVGILVVFLGLVILIACIYVMGALNKKADGSKNTAGPKPAPAPMAAPAPVPPIQPEQEIAENDDALIAVITAAIAAVWQGEQSGFVVRRVRRADGRARAAREEQIYSHF